MDERRSLALLGWTIGGIVGLMFTLNAVALALGPGGSPAKRLLVSHAGASLKATVNAALATKADPS